MIIMLPLTLNTVFWGISERSVSPAHAEKYIHSLGLTFGIYVTREFPWPQ